MSAEVVDSNPYSRLMALQRMGIVKDYERIRDKSVRALEPVASAAVEGSAAAGLHCETFCWMMPDLEGRPSSSREPDSTQVHLIVRDAPLAACRGSVRRSVSHMMMSVSATILQVAIVGMGGVGSVAAEMLTRCGIGRLLMYGMRWSQSQASV